MKLVKLGLCLALLMAVSFPATAQIQQMKLNIPFSFVAAGRTLPAGHYTVSRVWVANSNSWQIVGNQGSAQLITYLVESPKVEHTPSLIFLQRGDTYSLVQIWDGAHFGRQLPQFNVKKTVVAQNSKYVEIGAEKPTESRHRACLLRQVLPVLEAARLKSGCGKTEEM